MPASFFLAYHIHDSLLLGIYSATCRRPSPSCLCFLLMHASASSCWHAMPMPDLKAAYLPSVPYTCLPALTSMLPLPSVFLQEGDGQGPPFVTTFVPLPDRMPFLPAFALPYCLYHGSTYYLCHFLPTYMYPSNLHHLLSCMVWLDIVSAYCMAGWRWWWAGLCACLCPGQISFAYRL